MVDPQTTYEIPASSYTADGKDYAGDNICNLYIIGQSFSDVSYWTLGESFLKHHYVTYDASDSSQPRVGLARSTTGPPVAPVQPVELPVISESDSDSENETPPDPRKYVPGAATAVAAAAASLVALALAF